MCYTAFGMGKGTLPLSITLLFFFLIINFSTNKITSLASPSHPISEPVISSAERKRASLVQPFHHRSSAASRSSSASHKSFSPLKNGKSAWLNHTRKVGTIGVGLIVPLFLLWKEVNASPFDPHALPIFLGLCFFNGWYIRLTDHEKGLAFALIIGSFKHRGSETYTEHYLALVYADKNGNFVTAQAFPDPDSVSIEMTSQGYAGLPSNFTWRADGLGELHVDDRRGHFDFSLPGLSAKANLHDRVPWDKGSPDSAGPEGWLGNTFLLPCRYFVHSLASKTSYRLKIRDRGGGGGLGNGGSTEITGRGYSHMESNHGNHFPQGWIWVQAIAPHREAKLVMVGGKFEIGPVAPSTWVIGYRSSRFQWNFRTTDLDRITSTVNYSERSLRLAAESRCGQRRLEVSIIAPEGSFGSPIYVPTPSGFSCIPGCRESFTAKAVIKAYDKSTACNKIVLIEEYEIEMAALEFGGDLQKL